MNADTGKGAPGIAGVRRVELDAEHRDGGRRRSARTHHQAQHDDGERGSAGPDTRLDSIRNADRGLR